MKKRYCRVPSLKSRWLSFRNKVHLNQSKTQGILKTKLEVIYKSFISVISNRNRQAKKWGYL